MRTNPEPTLDAQLAALAAQIRACRICRDTPSGEALPHEPRPVLRVSSTARICLCGQAPGVRVHASGMPFTDPSGDRLREWMGVSTQEFYDTRRIAIVPMGFCFPGLDANGADLPPRRECAPLWRDALFAALPGFELVLLIGHYAQRWHLRRDACLIAANEHLHQSNEGLRRSWTKLMHKQLQSQAKSSLTATVANWGAYVASPARPRYLPLPHPSWRNNAWLKRNPWFDAEVVPYMRAEVRRLLGAPV